MSTTEIAPIHRRRRKRLYKLSDVHVRSLAIVPRGANRRTWALFKSGEPASPTGDAELDELVASLTREDAGELLAALDQADRDQAIAKLGEPSTIDANAIRAMTDDELRACAQGARMLPGAVGRELRAHVAGERGERREVRNTVQKFMASSGLR